MSGQAREAFKNRDLKILRFWETIQRNLPIRFEQRKCHFHSLSLDTIHFHQNYFLTPQKRIGDNYKLFLAKHSRNVKSGVMDRNPVTVNRNGSRMWQNHRKIWIKKDTLLDRNWRWIINFISGLSFWWGPFSSHTDDKWVIFAEKLVGRTKKPCKGRLPRNVKKSEKETKYINFTPPCDKGKHSTWIQD